MKKPSHVVAIGASAGGLESIERFFRAMPEQTGMAFVVIQHLSPDYKSLMDELLARFSAMPARQVTEDTEIHENCIYLIPPAQEMSIDGNVLKVQQRRKESGLFLPVNIFFRSLAASWGDKAIAVVLSGTGSDGAHGALDVRDAGGSVLAESLETAGFPGMPTCVINTGCADAVLPPEEMPKFILDYIQKSPKFDADTGDFFPIEDSEHGLSGILELLRRNYRIDFNHYKPGTITRRIERRLATQVDGGIFGIEEYRQHLAQNNNALDALYKDLLIGVTRFFRDPEAFELLATTVIPQILDKVPEDAEVRIWDCGCSTGEEAYSLAILFLDAFEKRGRAPLLKILATDLHEESLAFASAGIYREDSFTDMPLHLKDKYFESLGDGRYRVVSLLRQHLLFSRHNLLNDPPFTKIHLASCRNLLIYLQPKAQLRALASFHYSLEVAGVLFLGASESLAELTDEFEVIDRHAKLFRKIRDNRQISSGTFINAPLLARQAEKGIASSAQFRVYESLMKMFLPDGILVNDQLEIMHLFGEAKRYIQMGDGRFTGDVIKLLPKELHLPVAAAHRNVLKTQQATQLRAISVTMGGVVESTRVGILPVPEGGKFGQHFLITLAKDDVPVTPRPDIEVAASEETNLHTQTKAYVLDLESELQRTRESLQATVEELETSNEELQASNEELLASNEELQSTNEELHSVNEELYSVNGEYELKIDELDRTSTNLRNLIESTETATIFLDNAGHLRLFTPRAREIFSFLPQDIGRDFRHFRDNINDEYLIADIEEVMIRKAEIMRQLVAPSRQSYIRRCSLYRDSSGSVGGVVINYTDTSHLTAANRALEESENSFERILQRIPSAVLVVNAQRLIALANPHAELVFGAKSEQLVGLRLDNLFDAPADLEDFLQQHASEVVSPKSQGSIGRRLNGAVFPVEMNCVPLELHGEPYQLLVLADVTERYETEQAQKLALEAAENLVRTRTFFMANMSHEIRTPLNGVLGMAQIGMLPKNRNNPEKMLSCFDKIMSVGTHLRRVVEDILDFSKIEMGKLPITLTSVRLDEVVGKCVEEFSGAFEQKGLSLLFSSQGNVLSQTDPFRVGQIINNLLSNALKFTDEGQVAVHCAVDDQGTFRVSVRDSGIGIKPEEKDVLFLPFRQLDDSSTRRYGGTGLGLSISRHLAQILGGDLVLAESQVGQGATFVLTLPIQSVDMDSAPVEVPAAGPASTGTTSTDLSTLRIFVAEDEPINQLIIQEALDAIGVGGYRLFSNGRELLQAVEEAGADACDLVLMDLEMPVMNGYDATVALKTRAPHLPVLALTAHAFSQVRERCLALGMSGHISKPFDFSEIREVLQQQVQLNNRGETA